MPCSRHTIELRTCLEQDGASLSAILVVGPYRVHALASKASSLQVQGQLDAQKEVLRESSEDPVKQDSALSRLVEL